MSCRESKLELMNKIAILKIENKAIKAFKAELKTLKEAFYLLEETSTQVENERAAEIKALKDSRDKLLWLAKMLNKISVVDDPRNNKIIQTAEALKGESK